MTEPNYSSFCSQLDGNLHGNIHVYTGDGTNMGRVPTAAMDPIFWLHHCNIDRIWASWNASGGQNPRQTNGMMWANTRFVFAGGNGSRLEVAISTVSDSSALPYSYDTLPGQIVAQAGSFQPQRHVLLRSTAPGIAAVPTEATPASAVPLGGAPRTVTLAPTTPENRLMAIAPNIARGSPSRLVLTLKDVQARTEHDVRSVS
jgi:tyrosinase